LILPAAVMCWETWCGRFVRCEMEKDVLTCGPV
jgi:hypothetical protein